MITDEERTFFILKFGTDVGQIFNCWVEDRITLTRQERYILAEFYEVEHDKMLAIKAQLISYDQPWYSDDDINDDTDYFK